MLIIKKWLSTQQPEYYTIFPDQSQRDGCNGWYCKACPYLLNYKIDNNIGYRINRLENGTTK
jgi:hypothetical protein